MRSWKFYCLNFKELEKTSHPFGLKEIWSYKIAITDYINSKLKYKTIFKCPLHDEVFLPFTL